MQDCTIPAASTGEAVIWSCVEKLSCWLCRGREGTALRSEALLLLFLLLLPFCLSVTLFLSHLFTPCSVRLLDGARASGIIECRILTPFPPTPFWSRRKTEKLFLLFLFLSSNALYCGILPHAHQSSDVPEHVHIRDGFTWEYAALAPPEPSPSPASSVLLLLFGLHRLSLKNGINRRGKHQITRMGFYGTLKMIFYKVSRISDFILCVCVTSSTPAPVIDIVIFLGVMIECWTRSVAHILFDVPLVADCAATAEDEQQCSRPPETPLF